MTHSIKKHVIFYHFFLSGKSQEYTRQNVVLCKIQTPPFLSAEKRATWVFVCLLTNDTKFRELL